MHLPRLPITALKALQTAPRLALSAGLPLLAWASGCSQPPAPELSFDGPRNVLFISLDTLRADACSLYGYEKPTTPFLEELGQRAAVFENHMVNSNNTLTSHATMLTGLLMMTHRADPTKNIPLAPGYETVAERFQGAGFETVAIASNEVWISRAFGLDQGFDTFESAWKFDAPQINARFVDWLEDERPRRFFGFLHYYDAHSELEGELPYSAPPEYLQEFAGPAPQGFDPTMPNPNGSGETLRLAAYLNQFQSVDRALPAGYADYMRACYDAGVAKLDSDLRELFAQLERMGVLDETLVVITSDHGEEFEDHGGVLHNGFYDEIMHVPLLILPPRSAGGDAAPASRVSQTTRAVDIAATLLDYAELPALDPDQGRSLRPLIDDGALDHAKTFFGRMALRDRDEQGTFKYVHIKGRPLFFDLDDDPGELENIVRQLRVNDPERLTEIKARYDDARRECDLVRDLIDAEAGEVVLNKRQLDELRNLGYIGD